MRQYVIDDGSPVLASSLEHKVFESADAARVAVARGLLQDGEEFVSIDDDTGSTEDTETIRRLQIDINNINAKIPATATELNKLTDTSTIHAYIENQVKLASPISLSIPYSSATAITMQFDGFINCIVQHSVGGQISIYLNGSVIAEAGPESISDYGSGRSNITIPVMKGDTLYAISANGETVSAKARFYTLRDYTNRS